MEEAGRGAAAAVATERWAGGLTITDQQATVADRERGTACKQLAESSLMIGNTAACDAARVQQKSDCPALPEFQRRNRFVLR